ncbi:MAG: hypothetical protein UY23_C0006G0026 [Candidatus Jorgensenbacteria bacterium GW2011_GWA1_48_11]|uniref:Uncharacterized protein n=1 Tax=Candidatus Jorgensenbacteria bacterium GW2011_GWA1_48_11 TaxID=1618660 RepID=A0A0G1U9M5_9BACT|nr:MAG: hypothetical protein UY23_C0006G0026 [Candidatus Jorgensenbacteria bacterium GW2011_GWA1_48_11]KKW12407.1 MAG: hypothetical protein UY51_C0005G0649 [Candidatus Jorgensenbacteria bacterium GW2011_GWB1_49_9]
MATKLRISEGVLARIALRVAEALEKALSLEVENKESIKRFAARAIMNRDYTRFPLKVPGRGEDFHLVFDLDSHRPVLILQVRRGIIDPMKVELEFSKSGNSHPHLAVRFKEAGNDAGRAEL